MTRHLTILLGASAVLIGVIAFNVGRESETVRLARLRERIAGHTQASGAQVNAKSPVIDKAIDVRQFATAAFRKSFDVIRTASPEQRMTLIRRAAEMPEGPQRLAAMRSLTRILIQFDPHAAIQSIAELKDRKLQMSAIETSVGAAPQRALPELAKLMATIPEEVFWDYGPDYRRFVIIKWSQTDPVAAAKFLEQYRCQERSGYVTFLVRNWAALDPETADNWLRQFAARDDHDNEPGFSPDNFSRAWIEGLFQHDQNAAIDYAIAHQKDHWEGNGIRSVASALFLQSPEEARLFINSLTDDRAKAEAIQAASNLADRFEFHDEFDKIRSPEFVANWILQFPRQLWSNGISGALDEWRDKDRQAMLDWIRRLPDDQRRTVAANYPRAVGEKILPEINFLAALPDQELRDELLEGMMCSSTLFQDETAAALEKADLPADEKAHLRSMLPPK